MSRKSTSVMPILSLLTIAALAWTSAAGAQDDDRLKVVATTTQTADLIQILAGDAVELTGLMGPGVDPHLYRPTESDIEAMNAADFIVYSGLHLEGQFDTVFESLSERGVEIYALAEPVEAEGYTLEWMDGMGSEGAPDPHFWFDPRNWQLTAQGAADALAAIDPANHALYQTNAEMYIEQLDLLYTWGLEGLAQIPEGQRYLVTSHDAFQYFGDAFGWEMRGIQGISTASEAGVGDVQGVADFVVENGVPVMFVESSVPPNTIRAVQEAIDAAGGEVRLGVRTLYSDAMGAPGTPAGTYIGMIAENVVTILQSFGYPVPEYPQTLMPPLSPELFAADVIAVTAEAGS